ncbi:hypothetical protein V1523DRAFT_418959 [Lipomyces doorenjongii]
MYKIVGLILAGLSTFIAAFVIGFIKSWKLTLILSSVVVPSCSHGFLRRPPAPLPL